MHGINNINTKFNTNYIIIFLFLNNKVLNSILFCMEFLCLNFLIILAVFISFLDVFCFVKSTNLEVLVIL